MSTALDNYRILRDRTDQRINDLLACHSGHLVCRPGCHGCCVNLTVFPVEYHAILEDLRQAGLKEIPFAPDASCGFLKDNLCVLYRFRPLICRTHGLPIAFLNEEVSPPECSVSFCPLNFTQIPVDELAFGPDNTLDLDQLNTELFQINLEFVRQFPSGRFEPTTRIPLRRLHEDL